MASAQAPFSAAGAAKRLSDDEICGDGGSCSWLLCVRSSVSGEEGPPAVVGDDGKCGDELLREPSCASAPKLLLLLLLLPPLPSLLLPAAYSISSCGAVFVMPAAAAATGEAKPTSALPHARNAAAAAAGCCDAIISKWLPLATNTPPSTCRWAWRRMRSRNSIGCCCCCCRLPPAKVPVCRLLRGRSRAAAAVAAAAEGTVPLACKPRVSVALLLRRLPRAAAGDGGCDKCGSSSACACAGTPPLLLPLSRRTPLPPPLLIRTPALAPTSSASLFRCLSRRDTGACLVLSLVSEAPGSSLRWRAPLLSGGPPLAACRTAAVISCGLKPAIASKPFPAPMALDAGGVVLPGLGSGGAFASFRGG